MKQLKQEKGFTLIEMLIVLLIISILILITVPNISKHFATIDKKGCDAYVSIYALVYNLKDMLPIRIQRIFSFQGNVYTMPNVLIFQQQEG